MTRFRNNLLAGAASLALVAAPLAAAPAHAADVLGGATGSVSGAASGAVDAAGSTAGKTLGGSAGAATDAGLGAGANGASADVNASGAGAVEGSGLSTGAKGGLSVSGEAEAPSPGEIENSVQGAAEAARENAEAMTGKAAGKANSAVSGAASGLGAEGKGAVDADTDASIGDGAALRGNTVTKDLTVAQNAGGSIGIDPVTNSADKAASQAASTLDPARKLTEMGYTDIEPMEADAQAGGELAFNATNAEGEDVMVVVDARTGAVVSEQPADTAM
ncbi:MAG: hypothetical protein CMI62_06070 [Parvibaculum sp.]|jgi:hypothetical protein|uniref:hypothetical protein n=1 Tax=Parvibaculum sp. TaxID=2024848 RepID=UPI000C44746E|nr:hypothetical protein [Parvibaculum sp.]MAU60281.1 hypothetical protein [Parvibaculum sp.]|tara:strand:- start:4918 stop:5745 length:828 start_codon:yes stop_codon:yes gene_type:complete